MKDLQGIKVLLLEGMGRQTLPMMRALHKLKCHITTYNASKMDVGYASRFPDKKILGDWDRTNEDFSYEALLNVLKVEHFDVVIPMTDFSATMLARHKEELSEYTHPAVNDWDVFMRAGNKQNTMEACMDNNIPCPITLRDVKSIEDIINSNICYPFIIKPQVGYGSIGFHVIRCEDDLRRVYDKSVESYGPMLIQEYIPQTGSQYKCEVLIDNNGEVKSAVVFDKTRWYPIDGGSTCCSTTVNRPDIREYSIRLLKAIGWKGYGDVDLIEDPRDGIAKVMEINPRITASVKVCFDAGVDFARQIVELETGVDVTEYPSYEIGRTLRYFQTDFLWFLKSPNRFKAKPSWFSWKNTTDQIWSWSDPWPWVTYTISGLLKFKAETKKRSR